MGKTIAKVQWLVVSLLWVYIVYRACCFAITEDESYSYFLLKTNYWRALPGTANTHWLNSLFMRIGMCLPGADYPYKLRLLSMACWWVYALGVIRISRLFQSKWVALAFFAAGVLNPFLVFYFSLSRGYAAGCAFAMLSLWQAAIAIKDQDMRPARWLRVVAPASVAVVANFSYFYFFVGITCVYCCHLFVERNGRYLWDRSARKWWLLTGGTFVFAIAALAFIKLHSHDLEYVGYPDLVRASFGSLMRYSLYYDATPAPGLLLGTVLFIALILLSLIAGYRFFRQKKMTFPIFSTMVFVVILLLDFGLHAAFGVSFLYGRTALVIYVTILPGVAGIIDGARLRPGNLRRLVPVAMGSIIFLLLFNFYKRINLLYFTEWPVQADTEICLNYLESKNAKSVGMGLWHRDVFIHYYSLAFPRKYHFEVQLVEKKDMEDGSARRFDFLLLTVPEDVSVNFSQDWVPTLVYRGSRTAIMVQK